MAEKIRKTARIRADVDEKLQQAARQLNQAQERIIEDAIANYLETVVPELLKVRGRFGLAPTAKSKGHTQGMQNPTKKTKKSGGRKK